MHDQKEKSSRMRGLIDIDTNIRNWFFSSRGPRGFAQDFWGKYNMLD